jgi:hypothetical protein
MLHKSCCKQFINNAAVSIVIGADRHKITVETSRWFAVLILVASFHGAARLPFSEVQDPLSHTDHALVDNQHMYGAVPSLTLFEHTA